MCARARDFRKSHSVRYIFLADADGHTRCGGNAHASGAREIRNFRSLTDTPPNRPGSVLYDLPPPPLPPLLPPPRPITHGSRIQREPVARRRKSPVNARDLVILHGRLTRNCVHYRRIRFGPVRGPGSRTAYAQEVCILHDTKISIN